VNKESEVTVENVDEIIEKAEKAVKSALRMRINHKIEEVERAVEQVEAMQSLIDGEETPEDIMAEVNNTSPGWGLSTKKRRRDSSDEDENLLSSPLEQRESFKRPRHDLSSPRRTPLPKRSRKIANTPRSRFNHSSQNPDTPATNRRTINRNQTPEKPTSRYFTYKEAGLYEALLPQSNDRRIWNPDGPPDLRPIHEDSPNLPSNPWLPSYLKSDISNPLSGSGELIVSHRKTFRMGVVELMAKDRMKRFESLVEENEASNGMVVALMQWFEPDETKWQAWAPGFTAFDDMAAMKPKTKKRIPSGKQTFAEDSDTSMMDATDSRAQSRAPSPGRTYGLDYDAMDISDDEDENNARNGETPSLMSLDSPGAAGSTKTSPSSTDATPKAPSSGNWTQPPPPAPQPSHATLPKPVKMPAQVPANLPDPFVTRSSPQPQSDTDRRVAAAREQATKHKPVRPSRLGQAEITTRESPTSSDKGDEGVADVDIPAIQQKGANAIVQKAPTPGMNTLNKPTYLPGVTLNADAFGRKVNGVSGTPSAKGTNEHDENSDHKEVESTTPPTTKKYDLFVPKTRAYSKDEPIFGEPLSSQKRKAEMDVESVPPYNASYKLWHNFAKQIFREKLDDDEVFGHPEMLSDEDQAYVLEELERQRAEEDDGTDEFGFKALTAE
jgi:hypothetical protein